MSAAGAIMGALAAIVVVAGLFFWVWAHFLNGELKAYWAKKDALRSQENASPPAEPAK